MNRVIRSMYVVCGLLAALLLFQSLVFHLQIIALPSPQEYREDATILLTNLFLKNQLPYTKSVMPLYTNVYGFFYNLVMAPIVFLFGSSYTVYRVVNGLGIFGSFFLLFLVLRRKGVSKNICFMLLCMLYAQTLQSDFDILARPDGLGEFLFLGAIIVPWLRRFDRKSLFMSIIFSILAFYTKPYFMIGGISCASYIFLFQSKKKGLTYLFVLGVLFGLSSLFTQYAMEFYFYNTVLFHLKNARYMLNHLQLQLQVFSINNIGLIGIMLYGLIFSLYHRKFGKVEYFVFQLVVMTVLIIGKFGGHDGNFLSYLNQLMGPFIIIVSASMCIKYKQSIFVWICVSINIGVLIFLGIRTTALDITQLNRNWNEWTELLDTHQDIYNAPPFAKYLLEKGKPIYDTGHTEYFTKSISRFNFFLFNDARNAYNIHLHTLDRKIRNREFDMVMLLKDYVYYDFLYTGYLRYFIQENYTLKEIKPLLMYHNKEMLFEIWLPKKVSII